MLLPSGHNLLCNFKSTLNVTLAANMYKAIVHRSSSLMKVFLIIKCILRIVAKASLHRGKTVLLNQEVFQTILKSSQSSFKVSQKNKVEIVEIDFLSPDSQDKIQREFLAPTTCQLWATTIQSHTFSSSRFIKCTFGILIPFTQHILGPLTKSEGGMYAFLWKRL